MPVLSRHGWQLDYCFYVILQTSMNVLELILVAKVATVLTRWAPMYVTVITDTCYELGKKGGSVKVGPHISHNKLRHILYMHAYLSRLNIVENSTCTNIKLSV